MQIKEQMTVAALKKFLDGLPEYGVPVFLNSAGEWEPIETSNVGAVVRPMPPTLST